MKSIFKKIAFVLALAMVVTMLPARAVSAASDGPQMYKTLKLYVGGDVTGRYEGERFAKVWNWKDDYSTVAFGSDNEKVATVNAKSGKVTAAGVGTATITATFTSEDGTSVSRSCEVTVKKNAVAAGIGAKSKEQIENGIAAGETVQLTAVRKDADGNTAYKGRDVITDAVRFASSNEEVFKVTKTTGKITAVGEGEATLYVWAVQSEGKDAVTGEYPATTEKKEYTVKVYNAGLLSAKQVSTTKAALTCGNADVAEAIAKDFSKLTATYTLNDNKITTYIKSAAVDSADAKVVVVELYNTMSKDVVYNFTYNEKTVSLTAVDPDAVASIRITTTQAEVEKETPINVEFLDVNGVVINAGPNTLTFTSSETSSDYYIDGSGYIYFFEAGKTATVKVTYDMGYDDDGNKIPDLTASAVIVSKLASDSDAIVGYATIDAGDSGTWASSANYTTGVLNLVKDNNVQLLVKYTVKNFNGSTSTYFNTSNQPGEMESDNGSRFTFKYVSTNDAVVFADETSGVLYPVAAGSAQIIIYRVVDEKEVVIGAVSVKVEASKVFTTFKATLSGNKLSTENTVSIALDAKDQLGGSLSGDATYQAKLLNAPAGVELKIGDGTNKALLTNEYQDVTPKNDNGNYSFVVEASDALERAASVKISLQVSYENINKTVALTLNVKKVNPSDTAQKLTYTLSLDKAGASIDLNLPQATSWWSNLETELHLDAFDSQGYYVKTVGMSNTAAPAKDAFGFTITKDNVAVEMNGTDGDTVWTFQPYTVSGSAIEKHVVRADNGNDFKTTTGTYVVKVYQGVESGGKLIARPIAVKNIVVKDSTVMPVATVSSTNTTGTDVATMIALLDDMRENGQLVIKRSGSDISSLIRVIGVELSGAAEGKVYVKSIRVEETLYLYSSAAQWNKWHGKTYTYEIPVNKMFYVK